MDDERHGEGREEHQYSTEFRKQQYFWFSPPVKTEQEPKLPLIVILHGGSGFAYAGEFLTEHDIVSQFPSYILVPMAPAYTVWGGNYLLAWDSPELPYVVKLINKLKTKHNINPNRVYIMGCSMGARGVFYAAKEYPEIFAAGVAISGNWDIEDASQMNKMPIYIMAGKKDSIIPIEQVRNLSSQIAGNGIEVKYKEFNMGHNCPSSHYYTRDVWRWLFSKTSSSPSLNP